MKCDCDLHYVLVSDAYVDVIISNLVLAGFHVHPAAETGHAYAQNDNKTCTLLALGVQRSKPHEIKEKSDPECSPTVISNTVEDMLKRKGILFHSIVVTEHISNMCWSPGNVTFDDERDNRGGAYRSKPMKQLTLIKGEKNDNDS